MPALAPAEKSNAIAILLIKSFILCSLLLTTELNITFNRVV
ncbi:protein of unknown function [Moritella yayanosii]|uniref:Uncharacterized protein n=1 Tax=Moritella yayanosii TaxID=69539 RepID=A0A330LJW9_9GAMM|nr:protein of unknown function [Moritella yayanosii]